MVELGLIPVLPLAGALVLLVLRDSARKFAGVLATTLLGGSFCLSLVVLGELFSRDAEDRNVTYRLFDWISAGSLNVPMEFRADALTIVMLLVVTGVGTLIHMYSIGYMGHDERQATFFGYLNLFAASMLVLVLANNFAVLFLGWELVGLCSYLLISFWNFRPSAAAAGKKAFIVNRIGDVAFLVAIFLIFQRFGTLDMDRVFSAAETSGLRAGFAAIPLLLVVGAAGKSAQVPLYVWLPDAMEGPTPVSALIHAATMVTAGVYLVARAHVLFEAVPASGKLIVTIGIITAALAAFMAMAQDDIKRVLAYSTISQLGYMFVAVGVGALTHQATAYIAGIFHLVTHAFFKALLFLGAGSVMHAVNDETDMKKMGGLLRALPTTGITFIIGWLAISGIPPLAGFFSKEAILATAWEGGLRLVWFVGVVVAGLTAFYMSRQVFLTFFGSSRLAEGVHPHESPEAMTLVLRGLAVLAALGGAINLSLHRGRLTHFLEPVFGSEHAEPAAASTPFGLPELVVAAFITAVSIAGIWLAYSLYLAGDAEQRRRSIKRSMGPLVALVRNKFYVDEIYNVALVQPGKAIATFMATVVDPRIIDGAVNGVGATVALVSRRVRTVQTGLVRRYVMAMLTGTLLIVGVILMRLR